MGLKLEGSPQSDSALTNVVLGKFSIAREVRSSFFLDRVNFWSYLFCILFLISQTGLVAIYFRKLPPQIPIFYSNPWGVSMLANNIFIFLLPLLAFFFIILNSLLSVLLFKLEKQSFSANRQSLSANRQSLSANRQSLSANRQSLSAKKNLSVAQNLDSRVARIRQSLSANRQSLSANRFLGRVLVVSNFVVAFTTFWGTVKIITLLV